MFLLVGVSVSITNACDSKNVSDGGCDQKCDEPYERKYKNANMSYDFRLCLPQAGRSREEIATAEEEEFSITDPVSLRLSLGSFPSPLTSKVRQ